MMMDGTTKARASSSLPMEEGVPKKEAQKPSFRYCFLNCSGLAQRACNGRNVLNPQDLCNN